MGRFVRAAHLALVRELHVRVVGDEVDEVLQGGPFCCRRPKGNKATFVLLPRCPRVATRQCSQTVTHHGLGRSLHGKNFVPNGEFDALDFSFVLHSAQQTNVEPELS